ncbi:4-hydroxybenzoate 3-monooxygenase [Frankia sp. AgPm24]|uniref:4-hydroxybenzoate 3-monooxygenase n=1 Tax=Frankia sp. AgPm24 TaxID=631128 RepID=UPI00200E18CA|nr:4-hydroxybenzoate 3-monooxygenase [Frankia sp. AgPm24]MCK9921548.1 4-hydroxybenzoate 3-monooxygenase [Frankia sp. AgPm24]
MRTLRTKVAVVGAGPAGLYLSHELRTHGVESVLVEWCSREHLERRVRAGLLEEGTVRLLRGSGLAGRLDRQGLVHDGFQLRFENTRQRISTVSLIGEPTYIYGQQEVVKDLLSARPPDDGSLYFDAQDVQIAGITGNNPSVAFTVSREQVVVEADFIAGCDGYHGVSRASIPAASLAFHSRRYPFDWIGLLVSAAPFASELVYSVHPRGFALASMRTPEVSRLYLQTDARDEQSNWPHERIWDELGQRLYLDESRTRERGAILEQVRVPLRATVAEPMQFGRLFLVGDAAHIFPPTAAKGLNVALEDASVLAHALIGWFHRGEVGPLEGYSATRLRAVWRAQDFSAWLTWLFHPVADATQFDHRRRIASLTRLAEAGSSAVAFADEYVGRSRRRPPSLSYIHELDGMEA